VTDIKGLLLYYKVGSGKTLAAIACAENLARRDGVANRRVAVVVPASLRENFKKELRATGVATKRYFIKSFDAIHNMTLEQRRAFGRDAVLVVDEAQNFRNPRNKGGRKTRLDSLMDVARASHKRLLLSGTPIMNYPFEIGPLLALIDPAIEHRVSKKWAANGSVTATFGKAFGRVGDTNHALLLSFMKCVTLFYEPPPEVVRDHYPVKREFWVRVPMTEQQTRAQFRMAEADPGFETIEEMLRAMLDDDDYDYVAPRSLKFLMGPRRVNLRYYAHSPKVEAVVNAVAANARGGGKSLVFSFYLQDGLDMISRELTGRGVSHAMYTGRENDASKASIIKRYNTGAIKALLISDAGKEGLDLKNTAQVHIVEPAWNEDKIQQVIGRAVRYKSHTPGPGSVDVFRYLSVIPPDASKLIDPGVKSVLIDMSADEIMQEVYTSRKEAVNKAFLEKMIRVSDQNLRTCI
jgi:SNF2 family DNA or RNA helicase